MERLDVSPPPSLDEPPARRLARLPEEVRELRRIITSSGTVELFAVRPLVTLPYPRRYALWEACAVPVPYVWMTNRMMVVRWRQGGRTWTLLAGPSDYELGARTPYLAQRLAHGPRRLLDRAFRRHGTVLDHLRALDIDPAEVDYLVFDHLHTQDVRRLVGTTRPAPDLGYPDTPVPPLFPNARLLVHRWELDHLREVHPFQARFHQAWTYRDLDLDRVVAFDGDVLVGPGVAILHSPGHTYGNTTLVFHTARGIWCSSENGVAVDSWVPHHSRIPGVARWARREGLDVVLNFNTPELASLQYNAMVRERLLADPVPDDARWPQVLPSSELVAHPLAPGIRPTYAHGPLTITTAPVAQEVAA